MNAGRFLAMGAICAMCLCGQVRGENTEPAPKDSEALKVQIAKMRGRLLYKKGQIRKLEKAACGENVQLQEKISSLEKERRVQFIAANPKLEGLYAEQDVLEGEIQKLNIEKDKLKKTK